MDAITIAYEGDVRMIDGTSVRVHHSAAILKMPPESMSGTKPDGLTTKIHALTDGDGLPAKFMITPGNTHDRGGSAFAAMVKFACTRIRLKHYESTA